MQGMGAAERLRSSVCVLQLGFAPTLWFSFLLRIGRLRIKDHYIVIICLANERKEPHGADE